MNETVMFDKFGKAVVRICHNTFYDFAGKPRGFLVGRAVYDLRGQHRGFCLEKVIWDRMGRVIGFTDGANVPGLQLPHIEVPPVPYRNAPEPPVPAGLRDMDAPVKVPAWSMMRLENLLV